MRVDWYDPRCILCLRAEPLTDEHVIPRALGGELVARLLCKECNSHMGRTVDAKVRHDPAIRHLALALRGEIPDLSRAVDMKQPYAADTPHGVLRASMKGDTLRIDPVTHDDGSLLQSTEDAKRTVRSILRKKGASEQHISEALQAVDGWHEDEALVLADGLSGKKWGIESVSPMLE
ncbi:HNH endonuclease, partial [bacterium]|nr:HNH endonuclease [bacterium]